MESKQMPRSCDGIDVGNHPGSSIRYPSDQDGLAFKASNGGGGGGILRTQVWTIRIGRFSL